MRRLLFIGVLTSGCAAPPPARFDRVEVIDLTHSLSSETPVYPGGVPLSIKKTADLEENGYYMNTLTLGEHTGTHLDAPAHFVAGGASVDEIAPERLIGPGVIIDVSEKCETDPDYQLSYLDIKQWEAEHGRIPNGAILLIRTGWARRWADAKAYLNADGDGVLHFPGISTEAAEYLVKYRDVSGVGIDTLSVDYGRSRDFAVHKIFHAAGVYHIENVADLERVPTTGATIVAAPLKIAGGSGAPCRVLALIGGRVEPTRPAAGPKYLIEFGWDIPNERTLADAAAAGTPFDGAVFDAELMDSSGKRERFSWLSFGDYRMTPGQVSRIVADLRRTPATFRRRSFIRFNVTPGAVDWFDDWTGILSNARGAARIARQAGLAGILFDVEQYQGRIFDYRTKPGDRPFHACAEQARHRGAEFIRAVNEEHPAIEIMLTFGYSLAERGANRAEAEYGLLPSFLDGIFAARTKATRIIDGYEFAYPFKTAKAFERGREEILRDSAGRCEVAFGLWIDWNSGKLGWHEVDTAANWYSPREFESAVRSALEQSDRYVWIYSERLNWWTGEHLPGAYARALENAKRRAR